MAREKSGGGGVAAIGGSFGGGFRGGENNGKTSAYCVRDHCPRVQDVENVQPSVGKKNLVGGKAGCHFGRVVLRQQCGWQYNVGQTGVHGLLHESDDF